MDEVFAIFMEYYDAEMAQRNLNLFVETLDNTDEDGIDLEV